MFSSLRDFRRFWLSCVCPFDHLLTGTITLFDFPVFWLWAFPMKIFVVVSLCYFNFSFVSLLSVSFRFRFGNFLLSCLLSRIFFFLNKIVVGCFIYTYRHRSISFTENTLVKKNRTRQDTKFKGINCAESHSQLIMLIYTFYSEKCTLSLQFRYMCPTWTSNTIYNPAVYHFSFCHAILCQGSK